MQMIYSPVYTRLRYKACDSIANLSRTSKLIKYSVLFVDHNFASLHLFVTRPQV